MHKNFTWLLFALFIFFCPVRLLAQQNARIQGIQKKLDSLSKSVPGLSQKVQLQVEGASIQLYLIGISNANSISISVDPQLNFAVNDDLKNVSAENILVFLAQKYSLEM